MNSSGRSAAETAADWLRRGQAHENAGDAARLPAAIECYRQAVALLQTSPGAEDRLAVAWMNLGNALQKLGPAEAPSAVAAYDQAIRLLGEAPATAAANTLGAAWLNRGHAWQQVGTADALREAIASQDRAIAVLGPLLASGNRSPRINLAAAWLNRAQALLAGEPVDTGAALAAAARALETTRPAEREDPLLAEIGLKARHARCAALARGSRGQSDSEELGEAIDDALALVRHWETQGQRSFRGLAATFYRLGARFYAAQRPQFLAEFLIEALDPHAASGAMPDDPALHRIAAEAIARALADTYNLRLTTPTGPVAERLRQIALELEAAEKRRAELERIHAAGGPKA